MPIEKKNDAVDTAFFNRQLEVVNKEVDKKYPEQAYSQMMSIDGSIDEGATSVTYRMWDQIGASKILASDADDSPSVEATVEESTVATKIIGNHFIVTREELRNARLAGVNIQGKKAQAAAMFTERKHDEIALLADGTKQFGGLYGIVYNPNTTKVEHTGGAWSTLSSQEKEKLITDQYNAVVETTKGVHMPNKIALAPEFYTDLRTSYISGDNNVSIMQRLESALGVTFVSHYRLGGMAKNPATGAAGSFNVMLIYWDDPMNIEYLMPIPYRPCGSPIDEGRRWRVETESKSAGVRIIFPLAVRCLYGF